MAKNDQIPDGHSLARLIKPRFVGKSDDGNIDVDEQGRPVFVFPQAFELREEEEYLSVTSLDLFEGDRNEKLVCAAKAIQSSTLTKKLSKKGAIALGLAGNMKVDCSSFGYAIRILEEPEVENIGHVAVRRYPRDVPELYELLADNCFAERHIFGNLIP